MVIWATCKDGRSPPYYHINGQAAGEVKSWNKKVEQQEVPECLIVTEFEKHHLLHGVVDPLVGMLDVWIE